MARSSHVNIQIAPFSGAARRSPTPGNHAEIPRGESHRHGVPRTADQRHIPQQADRALYYWNVLNRLATEAAPPADTRPSAPDPARNLSRDDQRGGEGVRAGRSRIQLIVIIRLLCVYAGIGLVS